MHRDQLKLSPLGGRHLGLAGNQLVAAAALGPDVAAEGIPVTRVAGYNNLAHR
jgi:hypothetical protein